MIGYEYKVVPAPAKGLKAPGVKGPEARFAHALEHRINDLAAEGWEYQRSDILPSEERQGLTSSQTVYRSVLIFRRALAQNPEEGSDTLPDTAAGVADTTAPATPPEDAPEAAIADSDEASRAEDVKKEGAT